MWLEVVQSLDRNGPNGLFRQQPVIENRPHPSSCCDGGARLDGRMGADEFGRRPVLGGPRGEVGC